MEDYIINIELINSYLNAELDAKAIENFESKLTKEADFKTLFDEHLIVINGIDRTQLKSEISKASSSYIKFKWLSNLGLATGILAICVVAMYFVFKPAQPESVIIPKVNSHTEQQTEIHQETSIETLEEKATTEQNSILLQEPNATNRIVVITDTTIAANTKNEDIIFDPIRPQYKKASRFTIDTTKDTILVGKEGTRIHIPADAFSNVATNQQIRGIVSFELEEYYALSDMLLANLTTRSDNQVLETGGMINLSAFQDDQELKLSKLIQIEVPTKNKKNDMQLFTGQETENGINWIIDDTSSVNQQLEEITNVPFAVIEKVPSFPECQGMRNKEKKECVTNTFQRIINRRFNADLFKDFNVNNTLRVFITFTIDTNGDITNISSRPTASGIQEEVERVLALVPRLSPGLQRNIAVNTLYSIPITIKFDDIDTNSIIGNSNQDSTRTSNNSVLRSIVYDTVFYYKRTPIEDIKEILHNNNANVDAAFIDRYQKYKKKRLIQERKINGESYVFIRKAVLEDPNSGFKIFPTDSITRGGNVIRKRWDKTQIPDRQFTRLVPRQTGNDNYLFRTSGLGWINCDRFIGVNIPKIKYKIKIKNSDGANVKMVFKNRRSILPGIRDKNSFDFGNIPKDKDVTLVAIRIVGNQYQLAIKAINIEDTEELSLVFKVYTIKDLQKELEKLDDLF